MQPPKSLQNPLLILVSTRLQIRAIRIKVADVFVSIRSHAANPVHRLIASIARRDDILPVLIIASQEIPALHPFRNRYPGQHQ